MHRLTNATNCRTKFGMCQRKRRVFVMLVVGGVILAAVGCEKPKVANRKSVVPVRGELLFNGKPASGAALSFHPLDDPSPNAARPRASVESDGVFQVTTYAKSDGAPTGEYIITIYWPDPSKKPPDEDEDMDELPPDLLQGRFAVKERSVLRAKIGDEAMSFAPVDLGSSEVTKSREYFLREK